MLLKKSITRFQWAQLWALTFLHIVIDMFPGCIGPLIPAIRDRFSFSMTKTMSLITICYVFCNFFQVTMGHLRPHSRKPLLLIIGIIALPAISFIVFVPVGQHSYWILAILMAITGFGVAVSHPESLRAVHNLKRTPSAMSMAIFFNGGHIGFSIGALGAAAAVQYMGFQGLLLMVIMIAVCLTLLKIYHIRLSIEKPHKKNNNTNQETHSFWMLFAMAIPITTAATVIPAVLPSALSELGFQLAFGGLPVAISGTGIVLGALFWAHISKRTGQLKAVIVAQLLAIPSMVVYMMLIRNHYAVILLLPMGFCGIASYTLLLNMARYSPNLIMGQRMGIIVGGSWGVAALSLIVIGPLADKFSALAVMNFTWIGFATAAAIGIIYMLLKNKGSLKT